MENIFVLDINEKCNVFLKYYFDVYAHLHYKKINVIESEIKIIY